MILETTHPVWNRNGLYKNIEMRTDELISKRNLTLYRYFAILTEYTVYMNFQTY